MQTMFFTYRQMFRFACHLTKQGRCYLLREPFSALIATHDDDAIIGIVKTDERTQYTLICPNKTIKEWVYLK